jgi:glutamyl-tRNA synthetase
MQAPRLRFAPSPSGFLHIGGARTALFCWLLARKHGGSFILRIEDSNAEKSSMESVQAILDGLRWLGLDWDEGPVAGGPYSPYFQSERRALHQEHIDRLMASGGAYRCTCSPADLTAKREAAKAAGERPGYDRTCRNKSDSDHPQGAPFVIRLKTPRVGETVVDDMIRGRVVFKNAEFSDPVIVRTNGDPLYNFVVVVDDVLMKITHVFRGDDHLSNTPKQLHIYQALGFDPPRFAHMPLILGPDRKRLSKRHGATNVMAYDEDGYLPEVLVNFLSRLGWAHGDMEVFTRDELLEAFSVAGIGKSAGVWNAEKLLWLNSTWITNMASEELAARIAPRIAAAGLPRQTDLAVTVARIDTLKDRAKTLEELVADGRFYWADADDVIYDGKARRKFLKGATRPQLEASLKALTALSEWSSPTIEGALHGVAEALDLKLGKVAQPLRVSVTGTKVSPGIYETLTALGRPKTLRRIELAISIARAAEAEAEKA